MNFKHDLIATQHHMSEHAALEVSKKLQEQFSAIQHGENKKIAE